MQSYKKEPRLCDFNKVELDMPTRVRARLIKLLFKEGYLDEDEVIFLRALLWKSEAAENKIMHIQSIIYKTLLKCYSNRT